MEILITERTDISALLGMDWMKEFELTIRRIQLAEDSQSEREKIFNKFQHLFENNGTIKDTKTNIKLKPGHYPVKQNTCSTPLYLQEDVGRVSRKINKIRTLGKSKRCGPRLFCITCSNNREER